MNFYKRYPGDYRKKTARLTVAQHGVYALLLDEFYLTEQPLPADYEELYRICCAMKRDEQEAVRVIADRFFPVGPDGLRHNERAAEELEDAMPALEAARSNGKKGGRPRKTETQEKPTGFSGDNPAGSEKEPSSKPPHSPDISSSLRSEDTRASRARPIDRPEGVGETVWSDFLAMRKAKRAPLTATALDGIQAEASKAGMPLADVLALCCARGWQGFKASWLRDAGAQPRAPGNRFAGAAAAIFEDATHV